MMPLATIYIYIYIKYINNKHKKRSDYDALRSLVETATFQRSMIEIKVINGIISLN